MTSPAVGPFDPDDVVWHPVSTRLASARLVAVGLVALVVLAPTLTLSFVLGAVGWWVAVAAEVLLAVWVCILVPRQVRAIRYAERVDDLLVRRGILFQRLVVVPYGRMQYVDVQAGPLARRFAVARVQLHTASPATDASIPGLGPVEADRLRDQLASRGEARLAGL